jgi:hypothetical protein
MSEGITFVFQVTSKRKVPYFIKEYGVFLSNKNLQKMYREGFPVFKGLQKAIGTDGHQRSIFDVGRRCHWRVIIGFIVFSILIGKIAGFSGNDCHGTDRACYYLHQATGWSSCQTQISRHYHIQQPVYSLRRNDDGTEEKNSLTGSLRNCRMCKTAGEKQLNTVLFSKTGECSVIFEMENPVQKWCTDAEQYIAFQDVLANIVSNSRRRLCASETGCVQPTTVSS